MKEKKKLNYTKEHVHCYNIHNVEKIQIFKMFDIQKKRMPSKGSHVNSYTSKNYNKYQSKYQIIIISNLSK